MKCYTCDKWSNNPIKDISTCGRCKEVLKADLVKLALGLDPIYLSEQNRNKTGRKPKLTADQKDDVQQRHIKGESLASISKDLGVSKTTIYNAVHSI